MTKLRSPGLYSHYLVRIVTSAFAVVASSGAHREKGSFPVISVSVSATDGPQMKTVPFWKSLAAFGPSPRQQPSSWACVERALCFP
ncbi:hypothetical protein AOLI_G00152010 [Acnodon oligacanthus]